MPTILTQDGFSVRIRLPPREHGPPHVHVQRDRGSVAIFLPHDGQDVRVWRVHRMRDADVIASVRIVLANVELLLVEWRKHHGEAGHQ